jgi:hypothetical protein
VTKPQIHTVGRKSRIDLIYWKNGIHQISGAIRIDGEYDIAICIQIFDALTKENEELQSHSDRVELLVKYTEWLQKHSYIDTDATCEEPFAVDEFMKSIK